MNNIRIAVVQSWVVGDISRNITISVDELLGTKEQIEGTLQNVLDIVDKFKLEPEPVPTDSVSK